MTFKEFWSRPASDALMRFDFKQNLAGMFMAKFFIGVFALLWLLICYLDYDSAQIHLNFHLLLASIIGLLFLFWLWLKDNHKKYMPAYAQAFGVDLTQPQSLAPPALPFNRLPTVAEYQAAVFDNLDVPETYRTHFQNQTEASMQAISKEFAHAYRFPEYPCEWNDAGVQKCWHDRVQQSVERDRNNITNFVKQYPIPQEPTPLRIMGPFPGTTLPYLIPEEVRHRGMVLAMEHGSGKTNLLNGLVRASLTQVAEGNASIILMDSQSSDKQSLIDPWRNVNFAKLDPRLAGRVHIFDPDIHPALNILKLRDADLTQTVELVDYIFSSVLESKTTSKQGTLLRSVVILATATKRPSLAIVRDILNRGPGPYAATVEKLEPEDQTFFKSEFHSKTYSETKSELGWRLKDLSDRAPLLRPMLRSMETRIDLRKLIDEPNIIMIPAKISQIGDIGSEYYQRLFIAELLRAARLRKKEHTVYFYCDEAASAIAKDEKIDKVINETRQRAIAVALAFQGMSQIDNPKVRAALDRCAIKFESTGKPGHFNASIRGAGELQLTSVLTDMDALPKLTPSEASDLKEEMRKRYGSLSATSEPTHDQPAHDEPSQRFQGETDPTVTDADFEIIPPKRRKLPPPPTSSTDYEV